MDKPKKGVVILFGALRITAAAICAFLLWTFIYTMSLGQINHGNVIGSIFCSDVILLAVLYPLLKKKKPLKIIAWINFALIVVFVVYCTVISCFIISEMTSGEGEALAVSAEGTPQTVIVLGCHVIDGEPSPMLAIRLNKAEEYLKAHPDTVCIVTGGKGSNEIISEADAMRTYLLRDGIDDSRIYVEGNSIDTEENIRFSSEIIEAEGLPKDVVVVSECYHIYRGVRQAKMNGLHASGIYPDPAPVIKTLPSYWLREILALSRDFFFA